MCKIKNNYNLPELIQELIKKYLGPFRGSIEIKWKDHPEKNISLEIDYDEK